MRVPTRYNIHRYMGVLVTAPILSHRHRRAAVREAESHHPCWMCRDVVMRQRMGYVLWRVAKEKSTSQSTLLL